MTNTITIPGVATIPADQVQVTELGSTGFTQYALSAANAVRCGFLAEVAADGQAWFLDWANATPTDTIYVYALGGIYAGFIYAEPANFETLVDFTSGADDIADRIWADLLDISCCADSVTSARLAVEFTFNLSYATGGTESLILESDKPITTAEAKQRIAEIYPGSSLNWIL